MDTKKFLTKYPVLYHMAHGESLPSIRRYGLLSTSALLNLYEYKDEVRRGIEAQHRPESVVITNPALKNAVVRDQKPLRPEWLIKTLSGTDEEGWYRLLNSKVFFWATRDRLERMLNKYKKSDQLVLVVDTCKLLDKYEQVIELTHMNTGATHANPAPRSPRTFKLLSDYDRPNVAEVTIPGCLPDIMSYVTKVEYKARA